MDIHAGNGVIEIGRMVSESSESNALLPVPLATRGRSAGAALQAARFSALLAEYGKAPEVTRRRIHIETLQEVMPAIRSTIIVRLRDERSAQSRLDDILGSETRNAIAKHELIEIIRTTRDREPLRDALLTDAERELDMGSLVPIQKGRRLVEREIFTAAAEKVRVFGIDLLDIRFKRINYNESVRPKIYDRMISERRQIAERFLSEGNGEAARIRGNRVRELNKIQSEAYRQVEEIRGVADAKATEIYASAYNQSPESVAFYEFTRTMQSCRSIIGENTTLVLSTDRELFQFLKGMTPGAGMVRTRSSGNN